MSDRNDVLGPTMKRVTSAFTDQVVLETCPDPLCEACRKVSNRLRSRVRRLLQIQFDMGIPVILVA